MNNNSRKYCRNKFRCRFDSLLKKVKYSDKVYILFA